MNRFLISLVILAAPASHVHAFGGEVGNGGDVISCAQTGVVKKQLYALDYLLASPSKPLATFDVLNRVFETVRVRHPSLSTNLYRFIEELKSQKLTGTNVWSPVHFGLSDIEDEMIVEKLPPTCGVGPAATKQWQQAVVQSQVGSKRYYKYDADLLTELEAAPLQYSMLLVHEWLWQFADNALQVRLANQFLHEQGTSQLSAFEFTKFLTDIGLLLPVVPATAGYLIKTEVNRGGQLRDRKFDRERPGLYQPVFLRITNHSSLEYEVRMDIGNGRIDLMPETLKAGSVIERQITVPTVIFLYDRKGGWPAVQYLEISAAP